MFKASFGGITRDALTWLISKQAHLMYINLLLFGSLGVSLPSKWYQSRWWSGTITDKMFLEEGQKGARCEHG